MTHEAQLGLAARSLTIEPGVQIGGALMAVVGAALAVEVAPSPLRPGAEGPPEPSFGRKLFIDAQASISVPSTLKCSVDSRLLSGGRARRREACAPHRARAAG